MTRWLPLLVALCLVLSVGALHAAQDPQPQRKQVFRAGANTVPVYATVHDRNGSFVADLTQEDFEVRDDGKPQEITQFTTDAQPLSTLVLIDGSSSMMPVFRSVVEAANSYVLRMTPDDRTAIASFADRFQMRQPFTSNRDELLLHLRDEFNLRIGTETRLWESLIEGVLAVNHETNRRVVLAITDGWNWTNPIKPGFLGARDVLTSAINGDVMIYTIAMWSLDERNRGERPSTSVETLSAETGGGFVELRESGDINQTLSQVSTELHRQYVLGFTASVLDGKSHKLDVRVKRPGLDVRARKSYVAPKRPSGLDEGRGGGS